jgi:hypothetical protein
MRAKVLLGWLSQEAAIRFLPTSCIFDPPLTELQAEALWAEKKAVVDANWYGKPGHFRGEEAEWRCELYPNSNPGASKNGDGLTCARAEIQDRFAPVLDRTFESAARFNGNGDLTAR